MKYAALILAAHLCSAARGQCDPQWSTVSLLTGTSSPSAYAVASYNGEIVVGGQFATIGGQSIASLAASSDGGVSWHALGGDVTYYDGSPGRVEALLTRPEGLYATGIFAQVGGTQAVCIARWDGLQWHPLDQGIVWPGFSGEGTTLFEYNGEVVVAGWFFSIGSTYASHIVRWDGSAWDFFSPYATHSHGIYNATPFAGGIAAACTAADSSNIIWWNGQQWDQFPPTSPEADVLLAYNGNLYAGGPSPVGGAGARTVTRLQAGAWVETAPLPTPNQNGRTVYALHNHNGSLYAGGTFRTVDATGPDFLARWDGAAWQRVGAGPGAVVRSMATIDGELWAGCIGRIARYACACYANCDASTTAPILTANDFQCFLNQFAGGGAYANCDGSTAEPALTANDFQCFLNRFAAGCN